MNKNYTNMILKVLADFREVDDGVNANSVQFAWFSNAGEHENLWRPNGTSTEDG